MFPINSSLIRIFLGNPIREAAEKQFLNLIVADLQAAKTCSAPVYEFLCGA